MIEKNVEINQEAERKNRIIFQVLLTIGVLLLLFGLLSTSGSLMTKRLSGNQLGDPFDFIFTTIIFYLIPSVLIYFSLAKLKTNFRLPILGVVGITLFGFIFVTAGELIKTNNFFVRSDESINQSFTNVEILYQKRLNLIRNLDIASKRYEAHEQAIIRDITEARKEALQSSKEEEKISAYSKFDVSIRNLILNFENYPNLKADKIVLELMKEIVNTEQQLLALKTEYNRQVTAYNISIRLMPYSILARSLSFHPRKFIEKEYSEEIYNANKLVLPPKSN